MGKRIVNVLTVCIVLLFALSSCSLDSALEALRGNKYIEWGWTEADTTNVNAVNDAITNIEKEDTSGLLTEDNNELDLSSVDKDSGLYAIKQATDALKTATGSQTDITITLTDDQKTAVKNGVLATMTGTKKDDFMANINSSLNGAQRDVFVETMQEAADDSQQSAAKGSMALASAMISTVSTSLETVTSKNETVKGIVESLSSLQSTLDSKVTGEGIITKADVVQTQMITNLVATAAQVAYDMNYSTVTNPLKLDSVNTLINDAVTLSNTSKALSGDFDIISDMLGSIMGLIPSGDSSSGTEGEPATRSFARTTGDGTGTGEETGDGTTTTEGLELVHVVVNADGTVSEVESGTDDAIEVYNVGEILDTDPEHDTEDTKNETYKMFSATMEAVGDGLEGLFGATKVDGVYKIDGNIFSRRIEAYRMMSSAYDIIYSVVPENNGSYSEYSFLIDQYKATPNSAIDYALATVLSNVFLLLDDQAEGGSFNFVESANDLLRINPWISDPSKAEFDKTCFYFQTSLLYDFNLDKDDLAKEDGWKVLVEKLFSANVGFAASTDASRTSTDDGDVDDMLYYKAGVLDKMMLVGGFDLETIMGMFQVNTDDTGDIPFSSMKEYVEEMYKNMWAEYVKLDGANQNLRPSILDENV